MLYDDVRVKLQFGYNKRDIIFFRQGRFTKVSEDDSPKSKDSGDLLDNSVEQYNSDNNKYRIGFYHQCHIINTIIMILCLPLNNISISTTIFLIMDPF